MPCWYSKISWPGYGRASSDGSASALGALTAAEILLNGILPVLIQRGAAPDGGHRVTERLVIEPGALAVAMVVYCPVGRDAQVTRRSHRIDVGPMMNLVPEAMAQNFPMISRSPNSG